MDSVFDISQTPTVIDADELDDARQDPAVKATLEQASATFERFESEGRNL